MNVFTKRDGSVVRYLFVNNGYNRKARRGANARLKHDRKLSSDERKALFAIIDFPKMQPARKVTA